jgi:hypothetical protein
VDVSCKHTLNQRTTDMDILFAAAIVIGFLLAVTLIVFGLLGLMPISRTQVAETNVRYTGFSKEIYPSDRNRFYRMNDANESTFSKAA